VLEHFGEYALAYVAIADGSQITVKLEGAPELELGTTLHATFDIAHVHLFDVEGRALAR